MGILVIWGGAKFPGVDSPILDSQPGSFIGPVILTPSFYPGPELLAFGGLYRELGANWWNRSRGFPLCWGELPGEAFRVEALVGGSIYYQRPGFGKPGYPTNLTRRF